MCLDIWSSDVDFINSLIKEFIINVVLFIYFIFYFVYNGFFRVGGFFIECIMIV